MFGNAPFWIVGIFLAVMITYCAVRLIMWLAIYRSNGNWPAAVGRIESYGKLSHLPQDGSSSLAYRPVSYSYQVDGEYYSGEWTTPVLKNDKALDEFLNKFLPVGKTVSIRYEPGHPNRSALANEPEVELPDAPIELGL